MSQQVFRYLNGRKYIHEPRYYPLPSDLVELHRQNLKTIALLEVHGQPFCNPFLSLEKPPRKVLEVACGTAIWSLKCHEYFARAGHKDIQFTGIDIAPVAPDLSQYGVNWRFVSVDVRQQPHPFPDEEFDFVFIKDPAWTMPIQFARLPLADYGRILKKGGVMELWETDSVFRTLVANPTLPKNVSKGDLGAAQRSASYLLSVGASFAPTQHKWFEQYNEWMHAAFDKLKLPASPCESMMWLFQMDPDNLEDVGSKRLAIPFCETRWEKESMVSRKKGKTANKSAAAAGATSAAGASSEESSLSADQAALRRTILEISLDMIVALEPIIRPESGMGRVEWDKWMTGLTDNLLKGDGASNGECLEVGAWWARRTFKAAEPST